MENKAFRKTVMLVALLNLAYFGIEFGAALKIGSVSLFADSIDFLEDAAVNLLIFVALGWSASRKARVGMGLAALIMVPCLATLWSVWQQISAGSPPAALDLSLVAFGALLTNCTCAFLLARFRSKGGSMMRAAYLSARNDAAANIAIIGAGALTAFYPSVWPDIVVGTAIALINADAAKEVYETAKREHEAAKP